MARFLIEYTRTEVVRERVLIDADTPEEAVTAVEEYQFDNSLAYQTDSFCWELEDVTLVRKEED